MAHISNSIPWRFFKKIAAVQIIFFTSVLIIAAFIARVQIKEYILEQSGEQILNSLNLIEQSLQKSHLPLKQWCEHLDYREGYRLSLIRADGLVVCDNQTDVNFLDGHADRPEIIMAMKYGVGTISRFSLTLQKFFVYGVKKIHFQGKVFFLRRAIPFEHLDSALAKMDRTILLFLIPILVLSSLFSLYATMQVAFPLRSLISKIDQLQKVEDHTYSPHSLNEVSDEWTMLEKTFNQVYVDKEGLKKTLATEHLKLATVLESIRDGILATDQYGKMLFANRKFQDRFLPKYARQSNDGPLKNFHLLEVFRQLDIQQAFKKCLKDQNFQILKSIELPIKEGKYRAFFDISISTLQGPNQNLLGVVFVFHDTTEQTLANQMRENFVANVGHEVRTPLTAIKGFAQTLNALGPEDPDLFQECLSKIEYNSERLFDLFQDIIHLSTIESKGHILKGDVLLEETTANVLASLRQIHSNKILAIHESYQVENLWANGALIEQILTNLIDNAYKYSPDGNKIFVTWSHQTVDGKYYKTLEIKDEGIGIAKEHLSRVFERFYRVDSSRSQKIKGTGLGLSIVKHAVSKHNGRIELDSELNMGTTFRIFFPQRQS